LLGRLVVVAGGAASSALSGPEMFSGASGAVSTASGDDLGSSALRSRSRRAGSSTISASTTSSSEGPLEPPELDEPPEPSLPEPLAACCWDACS